MEIVTSAEWAMPHWKINDPNLEDVDGFIDYIYNLRLSEQTLYVTDSIDEFEKLCKAIDKGNFKRDRRHREKYYPIVSQIQTHQTPVSEYLIDCF